MPYFWQRNNIRKPEEKALAFAHTFLGVRIECAQCHKHPFDQWTKTDFEQFQAFFEPIQYAGKKDKSEEANGFAVTEKAFKESLPEDKRAAQKLRVAEFRKQIDQGITLPWPEVFTKVTERKEMSEKEIKRRKEKDPNFSSARAHSEDPRRRRSDAHAIRRSARAAHGVAARQGEPLLRAGFCQPRVGELFRPRHRGARR